MVVDACLGGVRIARPAGATLDLNFMSAPLDPRITFTRASTATYTDAGGTIRSAAINAPRWDYDPVTVALRGLLIEEARTNTNPNSGDISNATWTKGGVGAVPPVVTGNQMLAPDGTVSASMVAYPIVTGAGNYSEVHCTPVTETVAPYTYSLYLKGSVGGEQLYIGATPDGALYYRLPITLTTSWQRFVFTTPNLTAVPWYFIVGVDLRDAGQASKPAQTVYMWGAQLEQGAFATSYIPTASASVTRAQDQCGILSANMSPWFATTGTWMAEWIFIDPAPTGRRILGATTASGTGSVAPLAAGNSPYPLGQWDGSSFFATTNNIVPNIVQKGAQASSGAGAAAKLCLNGGAVATSIINNGLAALATSGIRFLQPVTGPSTDNGSGYIRRVSFWPRVLSDAEMQQVTT
jgi:hypothetical protein